MQVSGSEPDIMTALKAGTHDQHSAIERIMPFFYEDFSRDAYIRVLRAFFGFFDPMERELASLSTWLSVGLDIKSRQRVKRLRADLLALGESASDIELIPRCDALPRLETLADGLGCLYVLEGSTLGGQLIIREIEPCLGIGRDTGGGFFYGYGSGTGLMWHDFCASARKHAESGDHQAAMVSAARRTFELLELWMRKAGFREQ